MVLRAVATMLFTLVFTFSSLSADTQLIPDFTVMIPMRDGTELPTDLYFPDGNTNNLPCILMRCPAGRKAFPWRNYAKLAKYGYIVAIQDTRSALDSEGKTIPYWADGWGQEKDGFDTIEWLAKSDFTDGNVGTIGFSAVGITQQMLAPTAPPSLKCQYIGVAAGSIYHHAAFPGGQLLKNQVEGWLGYYAKDPSVYNYLCNQPHYNDFWSSFDTISMAHEVTSPAIHYGGWFDIFIQGSLDSFVARQTKGKEGARGKQKLIIGPWTHHWPDTISLGDFKVPENAREMPAAFSPKRWFDHYLKGIENRVDELPAVTYYVMGPFDGSPSSGNVWRTANHWPVPSVKQSIFLTEDYSLSSKQTSKRDVEFSYEYDPDNPVPTIGGRNLFIESGPKDQRKIEERDDVLVFTSQAVEEDVEITGHILGKLYFSSDSSDTDVVMRFSDVYPDGKSILIADSIFRTGLLYHGHHEAIEHDSKVPVEVNLDFWSTSIVIAKGHKLRVTVSSSNYPRFERSSNHGGVTKLSIKPITAHNKLHVGSKYPSRIILPVVRGKLSI
ncbi:MAG: CocE/NonD family hydrolase [Chlamydiota bacterium]|nr:CocE/NonD family hydrolase [Chlamydiota bacterium]